MKVFRFASAFVLLAMISYFGCQKPAEGPDTQPGPGHIPEYITTTISGRVVDDQQMPVEGAVVKAGTSNATTDINGQFSFSNISIDKNAAAVRVEKEGFFPGIKTLTATGAADNYTVVELITKTITGNFSGSAGGTVNLPGGKGSIIFDPNAVVDASSNASYTGDVAVSSFFIDPSADNFTSILPGTLRGITIDNNETGMKSYSMMAVELNGAGGQKLQIATGKTATIHFPIPASLQGEAPATIPLWYLNENTGLWKEEGSAAKQGAEYVGKVSHFSFWNCDVYLPLVNIKATIKNKDGVPLNATRVAIFINENISNYFRSAGGYTNSEGVISGQVPRNYQLIMKVYNPCGDEIYSHDIGAFSSDTDLGEVIVESNVYPATLTGTVTDCNNLPVTNGHVTLKLGHQYFRTTIQDGSYSISTIRCTKEPVTATVVADDISGRQSSEEKSIILSGDATTVVPIIACGNLPDVYVYYSINDTQGGFLDPTDSINVSNNSNFYVYLSTKSYDGDHLDFSAAKIVSTGPTPLLYLALGQQNSDRWAPSENITLNITQYNSVSRYVEGNFSGAVKNTSDNNAPGHVSCNFRVKY